MSAPPVLLALLLCSAGPEAGDPNSGADTLIAPDPAVAAILARWEAATADRVPVSEAEKAALRLAQPEAPEELLELSFTLRGPIHADELLALYDWRVLHARGGWASLLTAVPRDPLARAFTPTLAVASDDGAAPTHVIATDLSPDFVAALGFLPADRRSVTLNAAGSGRRHFVGGTRPRIRSGQVFGADAHAVVRAQNVEPEAPDARRSPIRTAEYVKPTGDGPIWKLERRLKRTPATRLVNNRQPLTAPRPW